VNSDAESAGESTASEALQRWYAAWNAHEVDAIGALMTDDVLYEDPSAPESVMQGRDSVLEYIRAAFTALPDLHLEKLEEWVTPGGAVIASYFKFTGTLTGTLTAPGVPPLAPTNRAIELLGMDRSEIENGRLSRHQIFWDMVDMGRQIGAFPERGSTVDKLSRRAQRLKARQMRRHT
jgi:steroid delta-isomerase-like uncharacterized protein